MGNRRALRCSAWRLCPRDLQISHISLRALAPRSLEVSRAEIQSTEPPSTRLPHNESDKGVPPTQTQHSNLSTQACAAFSLAHPLRDSILKSSSSSHFEPHRPYRD